MALQKVTTCTPGVLSKIPQKKGNFSLVISVRIGTQATHLTQLGELVNTWPGKHVGAEEGGRGELKMDAWAENGRCWQPSLPRYAGAACIRARPGGGHGTWSEGARSVAELWLGAQSAKKIRVALQKIINRQKNPRQKFCCPTSNRKKGSRSQGACTLVFWKRGFISSMLHALHHAQLTAY